MTTLSLNNSTTHTSAGKIMKASTYLILTILILASALTLTPRAYSQVASVTFQLQDGLVKVEVTSPVDVHQFQLAITVPSGASLDPSKAVLTGFMQNSNQLSEGSEYRWFNLDATPSKTGSLTVPSTGLSPDNPPRLIRLDLLDAQGNRIELQQTLPLTATPAPVTITTVTETRTVTTTYTITQPTTITLTTTQTTTLIKPTTVTTTQTEVRTVTQPTTVTTTITSTLTQPTTVISTQTEVRTVTQTTTAIKEIPVDTTPYIATIIALIIIIIILAILLIRRRRT